MAVNPAAQDGPSKQADDTAHSTTEDREFSGGGVRLRVEPDPEKDREGAFLPMTDLGNAERFKLRCGDDFRFCPELGWFWWDERRWALLSEEKDKVPAEVQQAVFRTVRAIRNEADLIAKSGCPLPIMAGWDEEQIAAHERQQRGRLDFWITKGSKRILFSDELRAWAKQSEASGRINCIPGLLKGFEGIAVRPDVFDRDDMAFNCLNGTLRLEKANRKRPAADIAAGKSMWHSVWVVKKYPHQRGDMISKLANVAFRPNAAAPVFAEFIERVQPDPVMRRFIAQWGGLSLTGDVSEQKLAFFYGSGRNGKGTFVEAVAYLMGDYAGSVAVETFLDNGKRRGDQATPDIARLPGVRFLRVSEPSKGVALNEGLVKMVTGGDPVDARHLNKGFFTFSPAFKMTISGNNKPAIKDTSDGIWRRMQLVPWGVTIDRAHVDKQLPVTLQGEASGILNWLLAGLIDWRNNGLIEPDEVRKATERYRDDSDPLGRFLADCCEVGKDHRTVRVKKTDLYELHTLWAQKSGASEWKPKGFSDAMKDKGFEEYRSDGMWWLGVRPLVTKEDVEGGRFGKAYLDALDAASVDRVDQADDGDYVEGFDD